MTKRKGSGTGMGRFKDVAALLKSRSEMEPPDKVRTTVYVDRKLYEAFQELCRQRGVSVSEVVEFAMRDILEEFGVADSPEERG